MPASPTSAPPISGWAICLVLVAGFVLLRLPYALWPLEPHPDERFYVVGAAHMAASGDWIVPRDIDGDPRLRKPPLPYWQVAAGFAAFGQTALGAKAAWLAGAAATLGLTFALARIIGAGTAGAAVAVAALGGHTVFAKSATTHLPDGPLVLGLTAALAGFATMWGGERRIPWLYLAYAGLGVAVLSKGLLPLLLVAVVLAVRRIWPPGLTARERRHEWIALALAAAASLWWFAVLALRMPGRIAAEFLGDQVARKAAFDPGAVLAGLADTAGSLVLPFAPMLLALFMARRRPTVGARDNGAVALLLAWVAAVVVLFSFADPSFERYILPAAPAAAALVGLWASRLDPAASGRRLSRTAAAFAALPVLVALAAAAAGLALGHLAGGLALLLATIGLGAAAVAVVRAGRPIPAAALLGATYPLIAAALVPAHLWLGSPTPEATLAADFARRGETPADVTILKTPDLASTLGLRTGDIEAYRYRRRVSDLPGTARIVVTTDAAFVPDLAAEGFEVTRLHGFPREDVDFGALVSALRARDLAGFRAAHGPLLIVARRP